MGDEKVPHFGLFGLLVNRDGDLPDNDDDDDGNNDENDFDGCFGRDSLILPEYSEPPVLRSRHQGPVVGIGV